jgi:cephalosporin-C deacetylase-like acetyl esterase
MVQRQDVEFAAEGDVTLRCWVFVPEGPGPHPGITMAHGYAVGVGWSDSPGCSPRQGSWC